MGKKALLVFYFASIELSAEQLKRMPGGFVISLNSFTHMSALMLEYKLMRSIKIIPQLTFTLSSSDQ